MAKVLPRLSAELKISAGQIAAVAKLFAEGNTIPFIARYRKEAHGNLDEVQISQIQERLTYYGELEERRAAILKSIDEQGKLTDELRAKIEDCQQKAALEDLYQPYKPKRRTRAMIAKEKGLEPLADAIWGDRLGDAAVQSASADDLQGARDIIAERIADMAEVRGLVRQAFATKAVVKSEDGTNQVRAVLRLPGTDRRHPQPPFPCHPSRAEGGRPVGTPDGGQGAAHRGRPRHREPRARRQGERAGAPCRRRRLQASARAELRDRRDGGEETFRRPRGGGGVRGEPAPSAARGAVGRKARARHRPRHPHRLQGGDARRNGQVPREHGHLSDAAYGRGPDDPRHARAEVQAGRHRRR